MLGGTDHADAMRAPSTAQEYAAVPPLLISVTGLESYLSSLSRQLGRDMSGVKQQMVASAADMERTQKAVQDMKRFLTVSAKERMRAVLDANTPAEQKETEDVFHALFGNPGNVTEADLFPGMLALAKQLLSDNNRLRTALNESTEATRTFLENQEQLKQQLAEANYRMKSYQRDFHELSLWLGTYDAEHQATRSFPASLKAVGGGSGGGTGTVFESYALATASDNALEETVSQSPLLLAFRRILLRDMVDRVTHTSEMQAREVGGVVATLKEDIQQRVKPERVVDLLESHRESEAQSLVTNYAKRLKEIEDAYVTRDELTTVMKAKADSMLLPVKADSAVVTSLERRVFDKYAELEERVAYFEAEREEFRNVVRSLVTLQQQHQVTANPSARLDRGSEKFPPLVGSGNVRVAGGGTVPRTEAIAPVQLGEMLTTSQKKAAGAGKIATDPRELQHATDLGMSGKTIYRVVGADRTAFATSAVEASAHPVADGSLAAEGVHAPRSGRATVTAAGQRVEKHASPQVPRQPSRPPKPSGTTLGEASAAPPASEPVKEYVGMTANQAAYAHFVTGKLSREEMRNLPVLPYEPTAR